MNQATAPDAALDAVPVAAASLATSHWSAFLLLLVVLFWLVGARRRLRRLRRDCQRTFTPLAEQLAQAQALAAQAQQHSSGIAPQARAALQALAPCASALGQASAQMQRHPLRPEVATELDHAWHALHLAWHGYLHHLTHSAEPPTEAANQAATQATTETTTPAPIEAIEPVEPIASATSAAPVVTALPAAIAPLAHTWYHMHTVLLDRIALFNQAVEDYNHAISQRPAAWLARALRMRSGQVLSAIPAHPQPAPAPLLLPAPDTAALAAPPTP